MAATHFSGPVYSAGGFVGNFTGGVTVSGPVSATSLASTGALIVDTTSLLKGVVTMTLAPVVTALTASSAVATDAGKGLVSVTNTGTGNNVLAVSPTITGTPKIGANISTRPAPFAINSTGALTGAQIATAGGYITTVSTSAVTITLPTGTDLGGAIGATAGCTYDLIFDNTGSSGSGVVTLAGAANAVVSCWAVLETGMSPLTLPTTTPAASIAVFRCMFLSATAYAFSRIA